MFYIYCLRVFYTRDGKNICFSDCSPKYIKSLLEKRQKDGYTILKIKHLKMPKLNNKGNFSLLNKFLLKYTNFYED